jgi:TRAP-type transport system periplasmic protein
MTSRPPIHLTGYGPPESSHSRALDHIAGLLRDGLDDGTVEVDYNILDQGRKAFDLVTDVEAGEATLCYFSTSYLADRVPELGIIDLPYVFDSLAHAHRALDGPLGARLDTATRERTRLEPLGYWDNGFRHLSNRWRDVHRPEDCRGLKIRLQPNWAHEALFRELGAEPTTTDLRDGIAMLTDGRLDAQENPFGNFVAYGLDEHHPHVTLTGHVYGARGVYASRRQLADWHAADVEVLRRAVRSGIELQRRLAAEHEDALRRSLAEAGLTITELTDEQHAAFRAAAQPVLEQARSRFDEELWALLEDD